MLFTCTNLRIHKTACFLHLTIMISGSEFLPSSWKYMPISEGLWIVYHQKPSATICNMLDQNYYRNFIDEYGRPRKMFCVSGGSHLLSILHLPGVRDQWVPRHEVWYWTRKGTCFLRIAVQCLHSELLHLSLFHNWFLSTQLLLALKTWNNIAV